MKHILLTCLLALAIAACQTKTETVSDTSDTTAAEAPVKLTLKWESDSVLTTCESVLYDKERDVVYVANINGAPDAKDNNGFLSKMTLDGKVSEVQWVKGLHAPKGLGLSGTKLYVADIDRVVEVDVTSGKITNTFAVEGAKFLNDVTVDKSGKVYISDMGAGNIHLIENGKLSKWMENIDGPNGLLAEDDKFYMLSWNGKTVNTVDVNSKQATVQASGIENLDGIEAVGDGGYLLSSWNGMLHYLDKDGKSYMLVDLRADSVNSADIDYVQDKNLLLVPTFFKNTVRAYELSK